MTAEAPPELPTVGMMNRFARASSIVGHDGRSVGEPLSNTSMDFGVLICCTDNQMEHRTPHLVVELDLADLDIANAGSAAAELEAQKV